MNGAGRILSRRFPPENCDPRALQVARQLQERENPQLLILFGSRVRGDWEEGRSDIDLLLVTERGDDWDEYVRVDDTAQAIAKAVYGDYVAVQTLPFSPAEFQKTRRSLNHVTARALREGVLMPRNPEEYQHHYEDEEDFAYEWSVADERLRHANLHLAEFKDAVERQKDDTLIGQAAQSAMEHALKALISINGMEYPTIHEIGQLTERARQADPEFRGRQRLHPRFYNQYAGRDEYRPTPRPLSRLENYAEIVAGDIQSILDRVYEIKDRGQ